MPSLYRVVVDVYYAVCIVKLFNVRYTSWIGRLYSLSPFPLLFKINAVALDVAFAHSLRDHFRKKRVNSAMSSLAPLKCNTHIKESIHEIRQAKKISKGAKAQLGYA